MGSELTTETKAGLSVVRHISGYVAGTSDLSAVEIIRNGEVVHSFKVKGNHLEFEWDDLEPLEKVCIKDHKKGSLFAFYYIRVTQKNGHTAWGSPIWVDVSKNKSKKT